MDRFTSLTVFVRVVETDSFSAAARRLNMSTTMVSNHVQALEERLGARLLNRTTRKVVVTEIGKAYYDRCTQILRTRAGRRHRRRACSRRRAARCGSTPPPTWCPSSRRWWPNSVATYPEVKVDLRMGESQCRPDRGGL